MTIVNLLSTILSNCSFILDTTSLATTVLPIQSQSNPKVAPFITRLSNVHNCLWKALRLPHQIPLRELIFDILLTLETFVLKFALPALRPRASKFYSSFTEPKSSNKHSICRQVIDEPNLILDHFLLPNQHHSGLR